MRWIKDCLKELRLYWEINRSGLFDRDYYLRSNLDVARSCMNPIIHYIRHGWSEGRNPSRLFKTKYYMEKYPDVANEEINPLYHYLKYGITEKRSPIPLFDVANNLLQDQGLAEIDLLTQHLQTSKQIKATVLDISQDSYTIHSLKCNRCLVFSHSLSPREGAPNSLFELCRGLNSNSDFKPVIVSPVDGELKEEYEELGIPVFIVKELASPLTSPVSACDPTRILKKLFTKLNKFKFSIVIVNTTMGFHVSYAAKMIGLPVIWIIRESENVARNFAAVLSDNWRKIFLQSLDMVDQLVFVSGYTQQSWCKGTRISPLRTKVIPNGIDIGRFSYDEQLSRDDIRKSLGVGSHDIMLLNVGAICDRKNQKEVIDALELLSSAELTQVKVFLVGARNGWAKGGSTTSEYVKTLNRYIVNSKCLRDHIFLVNETKDVQIYFRAADVFVFTSKLESYPRVILEAMHFKLPVISSPVFGVLEQTEEGVNALYYELGDPLSLAACIRSMLSLDHRQILSQGSEKLFNKLARCDQMIDAYTVLLSEVMDLSLKNPGRLGKVDPERHYSRWIEKTETPNTETKLPCLHEIGLLKKKPKISILVPVYNPDLDLFRKTLNSVFEQAYCNWELCLADDASTNPRVKPFLRELESGESRVKVCFREHNGHISRCLNSALEMATGEFCVLLDQDDLLSKGALFHLAKELEYDPSLDILYSDEDKISKQGRRYDPYFKTDFNYELLLTHNYMTHFAAYRTKLMREVGGYRSKTNGSQDIDMTLRILERISPEHVRHIPLILYHWRAIPGSTALSHTEKPYQGSAGRLAVTEHLKRRGVKAKVTTGIKANFRRVIYEIPNPLPHVSLVIPTRDKVDLLKKCIESILKLSTYPNYEILIVDNNSREQSTSKFLDSLVGESRIQVLRYTSKFNYAAINNWAVRYAQGEIVGFVNNDIEVITSDWLEEMVRYAFQPSVGMVGAKLYYPNDTIQHAGVVLGIGRTAKHLYQHLPRDRTGHCCRAILPQDISAVTAACMLMRKSLFRELGGFEESLQINYNDVDLCLRAKAKGYRVVWTPYAELYHHESASLGEKTCENQKQMTNETFFMWKRWAEVLTCDPYMNPNLEYTSNHNNI